MGDGVLRLTTLIAVLALCGLCGGAVYPDSAEALPGVVVSVVQPGSSAAHAGVRPGDLIVSWSREAAPPANPTPAQGSFESPFDVTEVEIDQAPRGAVRLEGKRGDRAESWRLEEGDWGLETEPALHGELGRMVKEARGQMAGGNPETAAGRWSEAVRAGMDELPLSVVAWLKHQQFMASMQGGGGDISVAAEAIALLERDRRHALAALTAFDLAAAVLALERELDLRVLLQPTNARLERAGEADLIQAEVWFSLSDLVGGVPGGGEAERLARKALGIREKHAPESLAVAKSLTQLGQLAYRKRDLEAAELHFGQSLRITETRSVSGLLTATRLNNLGVVAQARGDLAAAEDLHRRSLAILEEVAPGSLNLAMNLTSLGLISQARGNLAVADGLYRRSLAIEEKLAPGGLNVAMSLTNLGNIAATRGDLRTGEDLHLQSLAIRERLAPGSLDVAASLNNLGIIAHNRGDLGTAEDLHRRSLAINERLAPESLDVAASLNNLGTIAETRGDLAAAEHLLRRSLAINERLAPGSLRAAASLNNLAAILEARGDLPSAEDLYRQALEIRQLLAPGSLDVATSLNNLGSIAEARGLLVSAEALYGRALAISEALAPESLKVASGLNNLGNIARAHGDLKAAESLYRRSLLVKQRLAPGSLGVATSLQALGVIAADRGDLAKAEELQRRALAVRESAAPGSLDVAASLNNLGNLARLRADQEGAERLFQRSLAIEEELAPGSLAVAGSLNNLGIMAEARGDLTVAEDLQRRSLLIKERYAPGSQAVAATLTNLGNIAAARGDLAAAEDLHRRSLAILEKVAPASLRAATSLNNLGNVSRSRGDLGTAEDLYRRSLTIVEKLAPGSLGVSRNRFNLGLLLRQQGDVAAAQQQFCRAVEELESQVARLGGTPEKRSDFSARWRFVYRGCERALLETGEPERAFHVLERSRARQLLLMLAERDLLFRDLPVELDRERRRLAADYDRTQAALGKLSPEKNQEPVEEFLGRLKELRARQGELQEEVRKASPRLASLQYPQPLDVRGVAAAFDPGTVFLAYSVGVDRTDLYVLRRDPRLELTVVSITVSEEVLRSKIGAFRETLSRGVGDGRGVLVQGQPAPDAEVLGHELYEVLVRPVEALVAESERVLISPDGPLHALPFAALGREGEDGRLQYFVEWKPIHVVVSGTIYAELKKERKAATGVRLLAFGDPSYATAKPGRAERLTDPDVRSAVTRGAVLGPLPFTRTEVEAISVFFPNSSRVYLGEEATEERAKSAGAEASIVHFATHGLLDERFPLNSGLALTIPQDPKEGEDNGLLQAWEIFESVRLKADLVVLSACETGLGKEVGGEGLVGLTRAFQYAGARTVLVSLWSVADKSTSVLMKAFYRSLKEGNTKDNALQLAQLSLLEDPATSHPFHWAAFQIVGDWR